MKYYLTSIRSKVLQVNKLLKVFKVYYKNGTILLLQLQTRDVDILSD